jgi:hypothetical protein
MSLKVTGNQVNGLIRQPGDTCNQLADGTWEADVVYICRWANVMTLAPQRNVAAHPDFPVMLCSGCRINRLKPGIVCELHVSYRGIFGPDPGPIWGRDTSTEEVNTSMSEAPIETHPDFASVIGGTPAAPINGAVFDKDGKFTGWKGDSPYAGKESYLIPSTVYRLTNPGRGRPSGVGEVGTIQDPGIDGGPVDANWLYTGRSWRRNGGVYDVTEEYMLSGPGGFDPTLYPS